MIYINLYLQAFPATYYHGKFKNDSKLLNQSFQRTMEHSCRSYIIFISDPTLILNVIGHQMISRVVVVTRISHWKIQDFLSSQLSTNIVNLLIIAESMIQRFPKVITHIDICKYKETIPLLRY